MHCLVLWTAGITNEEIGRDGNEEETKEDNHINRLQFVKQNETSYNSFVCQLFIITLFCNFVRPYRMQAFLHDSFTVCSIFFYKRSHFQARNMQRKHDAKLEYIIFNIIFRFDFFLYLIPRLFLTFYLN